MAVGVDGQHGIAHQLSPGFGVYPAVPHPGNTHGLPIHTCNARGNGFAGAHVIHIESLHGNDAALPGQPGLTEGLRRAHGFIERHQQLGGTQLGILGRFDPAGHKAPLRGHPLARYTHRFFAAACRGITGWHFCCCRLWQHMATDQARHAPRAHLVLCGQFCRSNFEKVVPRIQRGQVFVLSGHAAFL